MNYTKYLAYESNGYYIDIELNNQSEEINNETVFNPGIKHFQEEFTKRNNRMIIYRSIQKFNIDLNQLNPLFIDLPPPLVIVLSN